MAKRYSKIYISDGDSVYKFLWAQVSNDGSVMIGTSYNGMQQTHAVFDEHKTYKPSDFVSGEALSNPKITFHTSGQYKTSTTIGLTKESIDRCTVSGTPLDDIHEPVRMAEILLPKKLEISGKTPKDNDININVPFSDNRPFRCSVSCCSKQYFHENLENHNRYYDTSVTEFTMGLEDGKRTWLFTVRQSKNDIHYPNEFIIMIPGKIKWGGISAT